MTVHFPHDDQTTNFPRDDDQTVEKAVDHRVEDAAVQAGTIFESSVDVGRAGYHPQPSNDPNDPLNWPTYEKFLTYGTICFFSFMATVNTSKFNVAITPLAAEFHTNSTQTAALISFNVLTLGLGNLIWVTVIRIYGRRPMYLIAMPLLCATNIWSYFATSYASLMAASVLSGFAAAAAEAPTSAVVADLFFVHQRGGMMMVFHVALSCGFFLGPMINAFVVEYVGWRWVCGWIAIVVGVLWLVAFVAIHETAYHHRDVDKPASEYGPKRTFLQRLSVTQGYNPHVTWVAAVYGTLGVIAYPGILWAGLTVGTFVGWNIVVQLTASRTFPLPPYSFKLHSIGLLALSGLTGAILAIFFGGPLIDYISNTLTRRAGGRREPEYRLPSIVIPAIIGPMGVLTFGLCVSHKTPWVGAAFGYGMQGFGLTAVSNVMVTYAVDSYLPLAGEVLVVVFLVRGVSGCLLSLYAYDWIVAAGMSQAFGQMVGVQYFFLLFVIPFAVWGKKIRRWTTRYGPLKALFLET